MRQVSLDKIVGTSPLHRNIFCMHNESGVCAFASAGFLSIVHPYKRARVDFKISEHGHIIEALSFSAHGRQIAVGEAGPNACIHIIEFNEDFDKITYNVETKTQENGFSCIAVDSAAGRLVSVGKDEHPLLLLWDITQPRPVVIGHYRLPRVPNQIHLSSDGVNCLVAGRNMLKLVDTSIKPSADPVVLYTKNINSGKFKKLNFVSCFVAPSNTTALAAIYTLTDDGVILALTPSVINAFGKRAKLPKMQFISIKLQCGETSCMSIDDKLVAVGCNSGTIIAIRREKISHSVAGNFSADGRALVATAMSNRLVGGAYENGHIILFRRKNGAKPLITIPCHRGPVCDLCISPSTGYIFSCGSDGSIRSWELKTTNTVVGKPSQEQKASRKLCRIEDNYLNKMCGVRCCATIDKYVYAGDNSGVVHVLSSEKLGSEFTYNEKNKGTTCMAITGPGIDPDIKEQRLATGGVDGKIQVYTINNEKITPVGVDISSNEPVSCIVFAGESIVSGSFSGIKFLKYPGKEVYAEETADGAILSLAVLSNRRHVVSAGMDNCIKIWRVSDGSLFRKYHVSVSAYPTAVAVDRSNLFIASALSDSTILILDIFSGDVVVALKSQAGYVTRILFHEDDLVLSTSSGCIFRWITPDSVHEAVQQKLLKNLPILDLFNDNNNEYIDKAAPNIPKSFYPENVDPPGWVFKESSGDGNKVEGNITEEEDIQENNEEVDQVGFDEPRPSVIGEQELKVDDFLRNSFVKNKEESTFDFPLPHQRKENPEGLIVIDGDNGYRKRVRNDDPTVIAPLDDEELKSLVDDPFVVDEQENKAPTEKSRTISSKEDQKTDSKRLTRAQEINQAIDDLLKISLHVTKLRSITPENEEERAAMERLEGTLQIVYRGVLHEPWLKDIIMNKISEIFK